jgi:hypothetical protein
LKQSLLTGGLLVCSALTTWAQNAPAPTAPAETTAPAEEAPERLEERAYIRKVSLGISLNIVPLNLFPKQTLTENLTTTPPVANIASVDPQSNRFGFGITAQVALTERWAIAVTPTLRKVEFHAFIQSFSGVDNSSTFLDERAKTEINEDTTARFLDIPILARHYSKSRFESGPRWFLEAGPVLRKTSQVRTTLDIVPPKGDRYKIEQPLPFQKNTVGFTAGIGGQFIDDFGIRAIPEVRYTRWISKPFEGIHGNTRVNQVEVVLTFAF